MATVPNCPRGRTEEYLASIAGLDADKPSEPWSRKEAYLDAIDGRLDGIEQEIQDLENNPDVADIVDTYADLESYDTSTLTDKDVIRVLNDETHDGNSTYYRYSKTTDSFTYIGSYKTYDVFTGTDGTTVGAKGLVPAPATTDAGKVLSASGSWTEVPKEIIQNAGAPTASTAGTLGQLLTDTTNAKLYQLTAIDTTDPQNPSYTWSEIGGGSGPTVVQTTGTSTTDVMSQNAVTEMVFANAGVNNRVKICPNAVSSAQNGSIAIGDYATVSSSADYGIAIGPGANVSNRASVSKAYGISLGMKSSVSGSQGIAIGHNTQASGPYCIAIGGGDTSTNICAASGSRSLAIGIKSSSSGDYSIAFSGGNANLTGVVDFGTPQVGSFAYNNTPYRLLTGVYDGQSAHDAATVGQAVGTTETLTIATTDWAALASSDPYTYSATVTATATIGANSIVELINDAPVDFATYGFAIGAVSGQSVTIYSIGQPDASVSLKLNIRNL